MSKRSDISAEEHAFQHMYNPLTLYSRCCDLGMDKDTAKTIACTYEKNIYNAIHTYFEMKYHKDKNIKM